MLCGVQVQEQKLALALRVLQRLQVGALQEGRVLRPIRLLKLVHESGGRGNRVLSDRAVVGKRQQPRPAGPKQRRQGERDNRAHGLRDRRDSGATKHARVRTTHCRSEDEHSADNSAYEAQRLAQHCTRSGASRLLRGPSVRAQTRFAIRLDAMRARARRAALLVR